MRPADSRCLLASISRSRASYDEESERWASSRSRAFSPFRRPHRSFSWRVSKHFLKTVSCPLRYIESRALPIAPEIPPEREASTRRLFSSTKGARADATAASHSGLSAWANARAPMRTLSWDSFLWYSPRSFCSLETLSCPSLSRFSSSSRAIFLLLTALNDLSASRNAVRSDGLMSVSGPSSR